MFKLFKIFHVSDLHIHWDKDKNKQVQERLKEIKSEITKQDRLIITGDITDDGSEKQYENALELLLPFKGNIVIAPGNHDFGPFGNLFSRKSLKRYYKLEKALESEKAQLVGDQPFARIIVLDSNLHTFPIFDFAQGKVGWFNRQILKYRLKMLRENSILSIVALHHSPYDTGFALKLKDAEQFLKTVGGLANYVLVGHEHRYYHQVIKSNPQENLINTNVYMAGALFRESTKVNVIEI